MICNKLIKFLMSDRPLQIRCLVCGVCLVVLLIQLQILGGQSKQLTALQAQKSLVAQIPAMEQKIRANTAAGGQVIPMKFKLEGITITEGVPYALIDGIVYAVGDKVGIYQSEKISTNEMTLKNSETQEIKILHVLEELKDAMGP